MHVCLRVYIHALTSACLPSAYAYPGDFHEEVVIDDRRDSVASVSLVDVDSDGRMDIVVGCHFASKFHSCMHMCVCICLSSCLPVSIENKGWLHVCDLLPRSLFCHSFS